MGLKKVSKTKISKKNHDVSGQSTIPQTLVAEMKDPNNVKNQ